MSPSAGWRCATYYPQLSDAERDEREEFVVDACYHMRDRFNQLEVWERLGLPAKECVEHVMTSDSMKQFRTRLFSRIVPTVKDIGLWGPRVRKAFEEMGVIGIRRRRRARPARQRRPRRRGVRRQEARRPGNDTAPGHRGGVALQTHPASFDRRPPARQLRMR